MTQIFLTATGGAAALLEPVMNHATDLMIDSVQDASTLLIEVAFHEGFQMASDKVNGLMTDEVAKVFMHFRSQVLESHGAKVIHITIKVCILEETGRPHLIPSKVQARAEGCCFGLFPQLPPQGHITVFVGQGLPSHRERMDVAILFFKWATSYHSSKRTSGDLLQAL
jgi:hypothetical protein